MDPGANVPQPERSAAESGTLVVCAMENLGNLYMIESLKIEGFQPNMLDCRKIFHDSSFQKKNWKDHDFQNASHVLTLTIHTCCIVRPPHKTWPNASS